MLFNPHKVGLHKVLKHIPLNALFDAPYKARVRKAVNIADLRQIAKARAHKVSEEWTRNLWEYSNNYCDSQLSIKTIFLKDGFRLFRRWWR